MSKDSWNDDLADLSSETVKFNEKLLKRDNLIRASKHWRVNKKTYVIRRHLRFWEQNY